MKGFKNALLLCGLAFSVGMASCSGINGDVLQSSDRNIVSVNVKEGTVPNKIIAGKFDQAGIKLVINYSDGTKEEVALTTALIPEQYRDLLQTPGNYEITILYRGQQVTIRVCIAIETFTVNFYAYANKPEYVLFSATEIPAGGTVIAPEVSSDFYHEGMHYYFRGWDKAFSNVTASLNIYGIYESTPYHTVTFYDGAMNVLKSEKIDQGEDATPPTEQERAMDGYTFLGWDRDYYDVTKSIDVYGLYTDVSPVYTVAFYTLGGSAIEPLTVKEGAKLTWPENPTREGYIFGGWQTEDGAQYLVNWFPAVSVVSDMSFYAIWTEDHSYPLDTNVDLKIWCPYEIYETTIAQIRDFLYVNNWSDKVTFQVEIVDEGNAALEVVGSIDTAADIYFFHQDQLSRLATAGGLTELTKSYADEIKATNGDGSIKAATFGDNLYAFPATADNGYFLYYNKTALGVNDIGRWENLIAKAENTNKKVLFNYSSAWFNFGFFYGAGADTIWTTNDEGAFVEYDDTYASDKGLAGAMGLAKVVTSPSCIDSSSAREVTDDTIAIVSGTWDYKDMSKVWGENLGCAELPSFTVGNNVYHTGSFSGNKLVGVKPQTDAIKARVALTIAEHLASETGQRIRFENCDSNYREQWLPSNLSLNASDTIQSCPQYAALAKQNVYAKPQGQFPGKWWDNAGAIGSSIRALGKEGATEAAVQGILNTYAAGLNDLLNVW